MQQVGGASYQQLEMEELQELQAEIAELQSELNGDAHSSFLGDERPLRFPGAATALHHHHRRCPTSRAEKRGRQKKTEVLTTMDGPEGDSAKVDGAASGPPAAPADRALRRQTAAGARVYGGLYFTPDAQTLVHSGPSANELSLWDLRTGARTSGGVERGAGIPTSAVSPDGQLLCVAARDGLAMYEYTQRSDDGTGPRCEPLWEISPGTAFAGVAFSRDSRLVAAARFEVLEVRDALSSNTVAEIEVPGLVRGNGQNCLAFSEEVLVVGGRKDSPNATELQLYAVHSDFEPLATLEVPRGKAHNLVISPDGTMLAVGMAGDSTEELALFSRRNGWVPHPPQLLRNPQSKPQRLCSTAFSRDGRFLAAGYFPSDQFALWDVEAAVCIRVLQTADHHACAFSPAGDLLATGGKNSQPITLHELRPPTVPLATYYLSDALPEQQLLSAAVASDSVVVLASGMRLAARAKGGGQVLWHTDEAEHISTGRASRRHQYYDMALQPTGGQIAVCVSTLEVSVRDVQTGTEKYKLQPFDVKHQDDRPLKGVAYSLDGSLILCFGSGAKIYDAATGEERHAIFEDEDGFSNYTSIALCPSRPVVVTTGSQGRGNVVRDLQSDQVLYDFNKENTCFDACFNDAGDHLAYYTQGGELVVCSTDDWTEMHRFKARGCFPEYLNYIYSGNPARCEFSPGEGKLLLLSGKGGFAFLNPQTGKEHAWSTCFRALALPAGSIAYTTIRWVRNQSPVARDGRQLAAPLILQVAVGNQLHFVDVSAFIRAFDHDGNFSFEQLRRLSDISPDAIPDLLEKWPHVINQRDGVKGNTVLHCCAMPHTTVWGKGRHHDLKPRDIAQRWLPEEALSYVPIENEAGMSALRVAVGMGHVGIAQHLALRLDPQLALARTGSITNDLTLIAETWPQELVNFINLLDDKLYHHVRYVYHPSENLEGWAVRGSKLFEIHHDRGAIRGSQDTLCRGHANRDDEDGGGEVGDELLYTVWEPYDKPTEDGRVDKTNKPDPRKSSEMQVVALRGFAGVATSSREELESLSATKLSGPSLREHARLVGAFESEIADCFTDKSTRTPYSPDTVKHRLVDLILQKQASAVFVSPFSRLCVTMESHCAELGNDAALSALMQTKLMMLTVDFKWDTYVHARVKSKMLWFFIHLSLAAVAMIKSTQVPRDTAFPPPTLWNWSDDMLQCNILQAALLVTNHLMLHQEFRQLKLLKQQVSRQAEAKARDAPMRDPSSGYYYNPPKYDIVKESRVGQCRSCLRSYWHAIGVYLQRGWNICNLSGIIALDIAIAGHFLNSTLLLEHTASTGVLLNAISFLEFLQLYEGPGKMILVLHQSAKEVAGGFLLVLLVMIWGFTACFAISMPHNIKFYNANATVPVLPGLFTTMMATVGDFSIEDYQHPLAIVLFLVFLFIMIIVMCESFSSITYTPIIAVVATALCLISSA
jgi:WD40 repeat protein